jgi:hypothetical protein
MQGQPANLTAFPRESNFQIKVATKSLQRMAACVLLM